MAEKTYRDILFVEKFPEPQKEFGEKLIEISDRLGINPSWLSAVINSESAGTFSPSIQNRTTSATGLIQFMPNTARGLGTTTDELKSMSAVDQMDYVYKYFDRYSSKITKFHDLYLVTFFPIALGRDDDWVFQSSTLSANLVASQNPSIDRNKDGKITMTEFKEFALSKVPEPHRSKFRDEEYDSAFKVVGRNKVAVGIGILMIAIAVSIWYFALYNKK